MNLPTFAERRTALFCLRNPSDPIRGVIATALLLCVGMSFAATEKPKILRTDWHTASSLISVSERGGIVVAPVAALDGLNEGLSVALQDLSRPAIDVALPGPSEQELELNALSIQITTNPSTSLPANAEVVGIEVALAINAQAINEKGVPLSVAPSGFSVVDTELTISDPAGLATSANRGKQQNANYGGDAQFVATRYGGTNDVWGTPGLPTSATFYRNNSLILLAKFRNQSQTPALIRADQFRFRFHYTLPGSRAKTNAVVDTSVNGLCSQDLFQNAQRDCASVQQCYAASGSRRQVCDLHLIQLLAQVCANSTKAATCTGQAAMIMDQTLAQRSWSIPVTGTGNDQRM